jgi:predicted DNA-binding transcriptional regulator AlpA
MQLTPSSQLLSTAQVSDLLNLQPATLKKWRMLGIGPKYVRVGRRAIRYRLADVKKFVSARPTAN